MAFGRRKDTRRRWRLSAKLLIASSVATVIGFSAICASVMLDMRRGEEELARQTLENLASGIDSDISRNIELFDLSLRAVASNMVLPEIAGVSREVRHLILFDHASTAKHFGAIQVFDADGKLTIDASTLDPQPENRGDEEYFRVHRDDPDAGLFISRPMLHRGAYAIVLSRRISGHDGRFLGVVAGSIRFSYFHELFGRLQSRPRRYDHRAAPRPHHHHAHPVRPRHHRQEPGGPADLESGQSPGQRILRRGRPGGPDSAAVRPAQRHVSALHRRRKALGQHPPPLAHGGDPDRRHHGRADPVRAGTTLFLAREIGRRAEAEDKLEELATTDALTGLKNRRKFDHEIDAEWRRAARHGEPVALLMIDADHFKTYNDTYGHQAGDQVLVGIAICISDSVRRAGDCTARFGGEEFAVLLPGNTAADALAVAETIRHKVEQWSAGPMVTTVSIGIASVTPAPGMDWSISWKPPTRRSMSPRPMAATSPWSPACRNCRWWRERRSVISGMVRRTRPQIRNCAS